MGSILDLISQSNQFGKWKAEMELNKKALMAKYGIDPIELGQSLGVDPQKITYADVYKRIGSINAEQSNLVKEKQQIELIKLGIDPNGGDYSDQYSSKITDLRDKFSTAQNESEQSNALFEILQQPESIGRAILGTNYDIAKSRASKATGESIEDYLYSKSFSTLSDRQFGSGSGSGSGGRKITGEDRKNILGQVIDKARSAGLDVKLQGLFPEEATQTINQLDEASGGLLSRYGVSSADLKSIPGALLSESEVKKYEQDKRLAAGREVLNAAQQIGVPITSENIRKIAKATNLNASDVKKLSDEFIPNSAPSYNEQYAEMAHVRAKVNLGPMANQFNEMYEKTKGRGGDEEANSSTLRGNFRAQTKYILNDLPNMVDADPEEFEDSPYFQDSDEDPLKYQNEFIGKALKRTIANEDNLINYFNAKNGLKYDSTKFSVITELIKRFENGSPKAQEMGKLLISALNSYVPANEQFGQLNFDDKALDEMARDIAEMEDEAVSRDDVVISGEQVQKLFDTAFGSGKTKTKGGFGATLMPKQ